MIWLILSTLKIGLEAAATVLHKPGIRCIGGNNYRLIAFIDYEYQIVFVRCVLTPAEYNKENWKNDDWFKNS
ncbi:type II toxin-antitoxin system HigB family toxin [Microcoleus sp. LAD1_D5]|uniref:type II toxin-antitoxin system HigB family toxin n=1 Tax=unclassified Microcoleus TaxID=2642155 RepID=UPI002FD30205